MREPTARQVVSIWQASIHNRFSDCDHFFEPSRESRAEVPNERVWRLDLEMRARLATIVAKLGVGDPNRTASQIALIINGAYATGLMAEPADLRGDLVDAAMKLLA
jgi:hypothetical protein